MLHFHGGLYRRSALFKCRHHAIAYGLDDSAAIVLHDPAKDVVAVMNHHESGSISMFFEICGRPLNVGKHYRDRATKLIELVYAGGVFSCQIEQLTDAGPLFRHIASHS